MCRKVKHKDYDRHRLNYYKDYLKAKPWITKLKGIRQRCTNPKNPTYKYYGAKGIMAIITASDLKYLWFRDKAYNMTCPSIDRINSKGSYAFENCHFIEKRDNVAKRNREFSKRKVG